MLKNLLGLAFCLALSACCSSAATTTGTSAGSSAGSIAGASTGSATGANGTTGSTGSAVASTGASATGANGSTGGSTGDIAGSGTGSAAGTTGGWTELGSVIDPGQGNIFASNVVPFPGPSNLPQVLFAETFSGNVEVFQTYWDGGYVTPEPIFDGGGGTFYNLQGINWRDGLTNLALAIDTHFNLIALAQVDGGSWTPLSSNVTPIPASGMAPVFDQATGQPWIAGLTESFHSGSNVYLYRLDDAGEKVPLPNVAAASINAAPCTKPDSGALICVTYITGFSSEQYLWIQTFDPVTEDVGTPGLLFDSLDAGFDGFGSGCAVTEVRPGTVVAMAAGLGPGMPVQYTQQFAYAQFDLTDIGTLQTPSVYASGDAGSPGSVPVLWTWDGHAFLLYRQTSNAPEGEVGVSLGGPVVPAFPTNAGVTDADAIPAGYADSADINYVALPTTAQGGKITVFSLAP